MVLPPQYCWRKGLLAELVHEQQRCWLRAGHCGGACWAPHLHMNMMRHACACPSMPTFPCSLWDCPALKHLPSCATTLMGHRWGRATDDGATQAVDRARTPEKPLWVMHRIGIAPNMLIVDTRFCECHQVENQCFGFLGFFRALQSGDHVVRGLGV